jgi:uncharacterized protein YfbU (UPF0304 family)
MRLSDGEKLILLMLGEIQRALKIEGEIDAEFLQSAILNEQTWGIPWKYPGIPFENTETPEIVGEVVDILDMWSFVEEAVFQLDDKERAELEQKAHPFGSEPKFRGFDGNNESEHVAVARFLVNDLDRFESMKGRSLNSHSPSIDLYRRMLNEFSRIRSTLVGRPLSLKQLVQVLTAQLHPEYR